MTRSRETPCPSPPASLPTGATSEGRPLAVVTGASSGIGASSSPGSSPSTASTWSSPPRTTSSPVPLPPLRAVAGERRPVPDGAASTCACREGVEDLYAADQRDGDRSRRSRSTPASARAAPSSTTTSTTSWRSSTSTSPRRCGWPSWCCATWWRADEGRVLVTSSIASTMPGSFQAVYNASKSFLQSFTEALQNELRDTGVTLTSLMPGPTETDFFERAGMSEDTKVGTSKKDDPAQVARQGFEAMMSGKPARRRRRSQDQGAGGGRARSMPDRLKAADAPPDGGARLGELTRLRSSPRPAPARRTRPRPPRPARHR